MHSGCSLVRNVANVRKIEDCVRLIDLVAMHCRLLPDRAAGTIDARLPALHTKHHVCGTVAEQFLKEWTSAQLVKAALSLSCHFVMCKGT